MKYILLIIFLFILLVLQAGLVNHLSPVPAGNMLLIFSVITLILASPNEAWFAAVLSGLMLDFTSATRDGTMTLCMLVVMAGIFLFQNRFISREPNRLVLFSSVAFGTVIFALALVVTNKLFTIIHVDTTLDYSYMLGKKLLIDLIANIILAYPVYQSFVLFKIAEKKLAK